MKPKKLARIVREAMGSDEVQTNAGYYALKALADALDGKRGRKRKRRPGRRSTGQGHHDA